MPQIKLLVVFMHPLWVHPCSQTYELRIEMSLTSCSFEVALRALCSLHRVNIVLREDVVASMSKRFYKHSWHSEKIINRESLYYHLFRIKCEPYCIISYLINHLTTLGLIRQRIKKGCKSPQTCDGQLKAG